MTCTTAFAVARASVGDCATGSGTGGEHREAAARVAPVTRHRTSGGRRREREKSRPTGQIRSSGAQRFGREFRKTRHRVVSGTSPVNRPGRVPGRGVRSRSGRQVVVSGQAEARVGRQPQAVRPRDCRQLRRRFLQRFGLPVVRRYEHRSVEHRNAVARRAAGEDLVQRHRGTVETEAVELDRPRCGRRGQCQQSDRQLPKTCQKETPLL